MKTFLRILLTPACWSRVDPVGEKITKFINDSLDAGHKPILINRYTMSLNGEILWAENYPTAFGKLERRPSNQKKDYVPDRKTVFRLYDAIEDKTLMNVTEEQDI